VAEHLRAEHGLPVTEGVVAELAEPPGAENLAQAGLAAVDLGVTVLLEQVRHLPVQLRDLGVERGDQRARTQMRGRPVVSLSRTASRPGGVPNVLRYSRLNCDGLSYPTR
jgi:hypothetical protein